MSGTNTGDQTLPTLVSLGAVAVNSAITAGTNTKITYDTKGLVTAGAAATTADIAASANKNYVTNAQAAVISNTSGTNTGDNATNTQYSGLETAKANLSGAAFTGAISATNLSGTNTGDQTNITGTAANITGIVAIDHGGTGAINATDARTNLGLGTAALVNTGTASGDVPVLDGSGKIANELLSFTGLEYKGNKDLSLNPTVPVETSGNYYVISEAGTETGSGIAFVAGDWMISIGTEWQKIRNSSAVSSVAGKTGAVTLDGSDISSGVVAIANGGTGESTAANAINALLPIQTGNTGKYLTTDGSVVMWETMVSSGGTVTSVTGTAPIVSSGGDAPVISINAATTVLPGSMSAADKTKLDGIAAGATNYTHPIGDGNLHVPVNSTTNNGKVLTSGETAGAFSWVTPTTGTVTGVTGTSNRITITGTTAPVVDISSDYTGQATISTLGTIGTGTWNGTVISPSFGGTGVNNGAKTITLGGNITTSGAYATTFVQGAETTLILPSANGTLATLAGIESLTGKTINGIAPRAETIGFTISGGTNSKTLTVQDNATVSGTNTGDQTNVIGTAANVTGIVAIANGGTGATTKLTAFDALSPMTTVGDIVYGGINGTGIRLAKGTDGQVLSLSSGIPNWTTLPTQGLTNFTESNYTYNTKTGVKLLATNAATDIDFVISPVGSGAILAQQPDGTATGGDNRASFAVDLQRSRGLSSQVASGSYSVIAGGYWNEANKNHATIGGGSNNTAFGSYSVSQVGKATLLTDSRLLLLVRTMKPTE